VIEAMKVQWAARTIVSVVLSLGLCVGQNLEKWQTPKADDAELYYKFFYLYLLRLCISGVQRDPIRRNR
jgi:hypothetical protein